MPKLLKTNTATIQIPEKVLSSKGRQIKSTTSKGNISRKSVLIETGGDKVKVIKEGDYAEPPEKKKRTKAIVKKPNETKKEPIPAIVKKESKEDKAANMIAGAIKGKLARKEMSKLKGGIETGEYYTEEDTDRRIFQIMIYPLNEKDFKFLESRYNEDFYNKIKNNFNKLSFSDKFEIEERINWVYLDNASAQYSGWKYDNYVEENGEPSESKMERLTQKFLREFDREKKKYRKTDRNKYLRFIDVSKESDYRFIF